MIDDPALQKAGPDPYETTLSPAEEAAFKVWKAHYAPNDSGKDYDLRGAFSAGIAPDTTGHWPDTFKKPTHPTFSVESQYATGADKAKAGHWDGETFMPGQEPSPLNAFGLAAPVKKLPPKATLVDAFLAGMPIAEGLAPPPLPKGATLADAFLAGHQIEPDLPLTLGQHARAVGSGIVGGLAQLPQGILDISQAAAGVLDPLVAGVTGRSQEDVQAARQAGPVARGAEALREGVAGLAPPEARYSRTLRIEGGVAQFLGALPSIALIDKAGGIKAVAAAFGGSGAAEAWLRGEKEGKSAPEKWQDALVAGGIDSVTAIAMGPILARAEGGRDAGLWRSLAGEAGGMAGISAARQAAHNVYEGRPVAEGVGEAAAVGGLGGGLASAGVSALRRGGRAPNASAVPRASEEVPEKSVPEQFRHSSGTLSQEPQSMLREDLPLTPETQGKGEAYFDPQSQEWRVRTDPAPQEAANVPRGTPEPASEQLARMDAEVAAAKEVAAPGAHEQAGVPSQEPPSPSEQGAQPTLKPPEPEVPKPGKLPPPVGEEKLVGIKNAAADAQAAFYGDEPPKHGETIVGKEQFESAAKRLTEDNEAGQRLVSVLIDEPRPMSTEESALMSVEVVRLTNERDAAAKAWESDPSADNRARLDKADADYGRALEVVTTTGTKSAQAFGLRRWMLKNDYSVAELTRQQKIRNEGAPISPEQEAAIKKTHEEYAATLAKMEAEAQSRDERLSKLEAETALIETALSSRRAQAPRRASAITEHISRAAQGARERMRARLRTPHAGVDPQAIADLAIIAAEHISKGIDAAVALVKEFGEWVKPHLQEVLAKAEEYGRGASLEVIQDRIRARIKEGAELKALRPYVRKLQEHFYRQGVREVDPMIDAVHKALSAADAKITRREAMDLISGYGDVRPLDKGQMAAQLRDLRGRMQQLGKLADMEKGLAPLKSGPERREPTAEERVLIKRVSEMKKKLSIRTTDPETQLKSALDSTKTRLRNQIEDLQRQIDKREADALDRAPVPTDKEVEALRKQRDELRAQFEDIFGKGGPTDAARAQAAVEAVQKSLAEYERRVKEADLAPKPELQGPPTEAVAKLKAQRDALAARRDALRGELEVLRAFSEPQQEKALQKQIDELTRQITSGDIKPKTGSKGVQGPPTETVGRLRVQRAMLSKQLEELRRQQRPRRSPEEIATQAALSRLAQVTARMQEKMLYGDFSPLARPRKPLPKSPAYEAAVAEHERVKQEYQTRKAEEEWRNKSSAAKAIHYAHEIGVGLPRAFKTAWDLSAPGRQGVVFALGHPWLTATEHIPAMLKAVPSEARFREINARIQNRPGAEFGRMSKLDLTQHGGKLTKGEEAIRSDWSDKIPGIRASNRAYITFLNAQRATMFDLMVGSYQGEMTPEIGRVFAHAVNVASGRGEAKSIAQAMAHAAKILWAPKLLLSRLQMLSGEPLWRGNARTRRKIALELYARPLISLSALMALGKLAGGTEEDDPRSTNFGKVRFGNTRVDLTGGMLQMIVLASRALTGEKMTGSGKVVAIRGPAAQYNAGTVWDEFAGFARKKLAPTLGTAIDVASGKNVVGEPVTPLSALKDAFSPLSLADVYDALREQGATKGAAFGLMSILGLGVQTYEAKGLGGAGIPELAKMRAKVQSQLSKLRKAREQAANAGQDTKHLDASIQEILDAFEAEVLRASKRPSNHAAPEAANR